MLDAGFYEELPSDLKSFELPTKAQLQALIWIILLIVGLIVLLGLLLLLLWKCWTVYAVSCTNRNIFICIFIYIFAPLSKALEDGGSFLMFSENE